MSTTLLSFLQIDDWWSQLGLRYHGLALVSKHEHRVKEAVLAVLREHPPVTFTGGDGEPPLSIEELLALVEVATKEAEREGEVERIQMAQTQRVQGQARVEAALAMPDADVVIAEGGWAGFTKGEAFAWSWNLFEYERRGIAHPGSQVHYESLQKLKRGDLPDVFGYAERAKQLVANGVDPNQYRQYKDALGAETVDL